MAMQMVAIRMEPALRREMGRLIQQERDAGRELTESALIRTALRQYIKRELHRSDLAVENTDEGSEHV